MNDYFAAKMAEIANRKQIAPQKIETKTESDSIDGEYKYDKKRQKTVKEEEIEYKTFKETLSKIENPFKGSNLFGIVGYAPYTVFESLDIILEDKERRALKKGKIMGRNIKRDPNFYLNLIKPTLSSFEEEIKIEKSVL
jgi:hypothetical protein